jgi:hypothetical protein
MSLLAHGSQIVRPYTVRSYRLNNYAGVKSFYKVLYGTKREGCCVLNPPCAHNSLPSLKVRLIIDLSA